MRSQSILFSFMIDEALPQSDEEEAPPSLLDLPVNVLDSVFQSLDVRDFIALSISCKGLHACLLQRGPWALCSLQSDRIDSASRGAIETLGGLLTGLASVNLAGSNSLEEADLRMLLSSVQGLTSVDLSGLALLSRPSALRSPLLPSLATLRELRVAATDLPLAPELAKALDGAVQLRSLSLDGLVAQSPVRGAACLSKLAKLHPRLEEVSLKGAQGLPPGAAWELLRRLGSLTSIRLSNWRSGPLDLTDEDEEALAAPSLAHLPLLRVLDLEGSPVEARALTRLLEGCPRLEELLLTECPKLQGPELATEAFLSAPCLTRGTLRVLRFAGVAKLSDTDVVPILRTLSAGLLAAGIGSANSGDADSLLPLDSMDGPDQPPETPILSIDPRGSFPKVNGSSPHTAAYSDNGSQAGQDSDSPGLTAALANLSIYDAQTYSATAALARLALDLSDTLICDASLCGLALFRLHPTPGLPPLFSLRELQLSGCNGLTLSGFATLAGAGAGMFQGLSVLNLAQCVGLRAPEAAEAIRTICGHAGAALRELNLSGVQLDLSVAHTLARSCTGLVALSAVACRGIQSAAFTALSSGLTALRALSVGGGNLAWREEEALPGFTGLTRFELVRRTSTTDAQLEPFFAACDKSLRSLTLNSCYSLTDLTLASAPTGLVALNLTSCEEMRGTRLQRFQNLTSLRIPGSRLVSREAVQVTVAVARRLRLLELHDMMPRSVVPIQHGRGHVKALYVVGGSS